MYNFLNSVLGAELGKTPAQKGLTPDQPVYLFANVNGNAVTAGNATQRRRYSWQQLSPPQATPTTTFRAAKSSATCHLLPGYLPTIQ